MISPKIRKQLKIFEKLYLKRTIIWIDFPKEPSNQSIHERILEIKQHIKFLDKLRYCFFQYMILMTSGIQILSFILPYFIMGILPSISYTLSCTVIIWVGIILNFFVSIHWRKMNRLYDMYQEHVRAN